MKQEQISSLLRTYVRQCLSPSQAERTFVAAVYSAIQTALGPNNCLQIGSYPRFTAITPLHDLDVLYILGEWTSSPDPSKALAEVAAALERDFDNPTQFETEISLQTHSVTISFKQGTHEIFAVDVVPAYIRGRNEYRDDTYVVPELLWKAHSERRFFLDENQRLGRDMTWIKSDPRGYISAAAILNAANNDFRKAVKFIKGWKASCKEQDENFPLKSFHIEQVVTRFMGRNQSADIFNAVFNFFCDLPETIDRPAIPDRADPTKYIDAYLEDISQLQRERIVEARDHLLIQLENISSDTDIASIISVGKHKRASPAEEYLFDQRIPVLTETEFHIVGNVLARKGGFRARILDAIGKIDVDRKIEFTLGSDAPVAEVYKWKVKNDDSSREPRGEITDNRTRNVPEHTRFRGRHYVECFAIRKGVCIGRSKQNVVLNPSN